MGDLRGRVHVAQQNLSKLQMRKMKGLKSRFDEEDAEDQMGEEENGIPKQKKQRTL